jgi:hypothetical protein
MHPTVIGLRAERVLGPGPIANRSDELLTFNRVNLPGEGLKVKANSRKTPVDAPGFEPGASPLQGERSTADLRARLAGAAHFSSPI